MLICNKASECKHACYHARPHHHVEMSHQTRTVTAVEARGYRNGWTSDQFAARQVCKLVEEVAELAATISLDDKAHVPWLSSIRRAGELARLSFDNPGIWGEVEIALDKFRSELSDCQVVTFCAGECVDLDTAQAAVEKAEKDVERGVR